MTTDGHDPGGKVYLPLEDGVHGTAVFSDDARYRYVLGRDWGGPAGDLAVFVGLNPSTADARGDDRTVQRCWRLAREWGHGSFAMLNIYAYRVTDPKCLRPIEDPVGPLNDAFLTAYASAASRVVAAWGCSQTKRDRERHRHVCALLSSLAPLFCLGTNGDGSPKHPNPRRPLATEPMPWGASSALALTASPCASTVPARHP